jgi:phosphoribosylformylglycinamidine synthase PurS subunit
MKAKVTVLPKQSILDPQGVAVRDAIRHHGLPGARAVRVGKMIELDLDDTTSEAQLHEVCRDLLSNPVIEDYVLEVVPVTRGDLPAKPFDS